MPKARFIILSFHLFSNLIRTTIVTSIFQMVMSRDLFYSTRYLRCCRLFCCKPTERKNIDVVPYGELELRMYVSLCTELLFISREIKLAVWFLDGFINHESMVHDVLSYWPSCTRHLFVQHYIPMHFILLISGIIYHI